MVSRAWLPDASGPTLIGGALCLDFTNSIVPRRGDDRLDYLSDYPSLLRWSRHAGVLSGAEAGRLAAEAARRRADAAGVAVRAIAFREALYRIFSAVAANSPFDSADVDQANAELTAALSRLRVAPAKPARQWTWAGDAAALDRPLWSVARAAADLLTSPLLVRVRECPSRACGRLFVDHTRNGNRRWCGAACGSRDKARRYYARKTRAARR